MPDEALQASLQGRPRQAPDFSPLALGHLHTSCLAVRQLIKQYLSEPSDVQLKSLITAVSDIHHTLQLLDRRGALLVTGELSLLLNAMSEQRVDDSDACAHTLVFAGERLADYVAHLQKPGAIDSALPLLPVINNCRACRGEELLSEMLVVASGIDLPDGSVLPPPSQQDINVFIQRVKESRQPLMAGLVGWFTDKSKLQSSLSDLRAVFAGLAQSCDAPTSLQPLVPLFESAEFICSSVQQGGLDNSAALHKLFAQIERMLNGYAKLDINDQAAFATPVSKRLFLNLLYYVALSSETSAKAVALRRRFRLDRFIPRGIASDRSQVQFEGVGDRLADSIRDAIELETEAARAWLVDPNQDANASTQIRRRLTQLEPAIMLLGAAESMRQMSLINQAFAQLVHGTNSATNELLKERIAESLVRLERALDTELSAVRAKVNIPVQTDLESILAACLSEAQVRLLGVEEDLISLFGKAPEEQKSVSTREVLAKLSMIDSALQVLPLPEVSPLLSGVQSFIARHENQTLSRASHRDLATVMVSLGFYLNSVLQPNAAAGQLLLEAEEALLKLDIDELETNDDTLSDGMFESTRLFDETTVIRHTRSAQDGEYDETIVDHAVDTEVEHFIDVSLQQMGVISATLGDFEQNDRKNTLITAYDLLASEASAFGVVELESLANANIRLLESNEVLTTNVVDNTNMLLEESLAVLPQLINQMQSPSDKVYGLPELLDRLKAAVASDALIDNALIDNSVFDSTVIDNTVADSTLIDSTVVDNLIVDTGMVDDLTLAMDVQGILAQSTIADDTLLDMSSDDGPVMTLDNTLEQVFYRECDQHMLTLRQGVDEALASRKWASDATRAKLGLATNKAGVQLADIGQTKTLPNREMLRALHTLTGSAQTVGAKGVIAIAQPLQKAALQKQRNGDDFNRAETEYIGELLTVLDARLESMEAEKPFTDDNDAVLARLQEFVAHSEPWVPERKAGLQLNTNVSSIENVFAEEARELLDTLRFEALRLPDDDQRSDAINRIMSTLHTIKGSARMAGQLALADRAHNLEDEIRLADGVALDSAVQIGLGELQTLLLVDKPIPAANAGVERLELAPPAPAPAPRGSEPMGLTEAGFENMLSLSTQATVSQARLGESMLRLREAFRDIESTSARLQRLPQGDAALDSAAVQEMLSDLESARRMFGDALLDAEAEHTHGSRADTTLHQTLIRAQLVGLAESHARLQHAATDAATETGKHIEFSLIGGELNIDKAMFRKILSPLEHLIRNAVVHGIEAHAERMASGKPKQGRVSVEATIDGTDLLISVSDDGAGIDTAAINTVLQNTNKSPVKTADAVRDVLCESGFTTNSSVDQLGGRGLGLTTVKQLLDELDGSLHLSMPEQGGTTFTLRLPQKIRIAQVVLVEHRSQCFAIPVNFIHNVCDEQHDVANADVQYNGIDYTCCSLDAVLARKIDASDVHDANQVVLVCVHEKHLALLVDKVIGFREIIAQPLGAQLSRLQRYLGGAVLSDGRPVLVPDFNRLLSPDKPLPTLNYSVPGSVAASTTALIVDDSITMRIAAEQMLQSIGIKPSLARDGAEAIELLGDTLPDVMLVDIDMPRMNGFDFIRHLRLLHPTHSTPIVMISTRDSDADRQEARELGVVDYLVKPYSEPQLQAALQKIGIGIVDNDRK